MQGRRRVGFYATLHVYFCIYFQQFTQIHAVPTVVTLQSLEKLNIHVFFDKSYGNFSNIHSKIHSLIYLFMEE